jgi:hypothetical protein
MTSALVVRRMTTIAAVAIVLGLVVGTIRVAAAWTVACGTLDHLSGLGFRAPGEAGG